MAGGGQLYWLPTGRPLVAYCQCKGSRRIRKVDGRGLCQGMGKGQGCSRGGSYLFDIQSLPMGHTEKLFTHPNSIPCEGRILQNSFSAASCKEDAFQKQSQQIMQFVFLHIPHVQNFGPDHSTPNPPKSSKISYNNRVLPFVMFVYILLYIHIYIYIYIYIER